ncbi:MAG: serine/threonine protein kinase [Verrucomicrobia bacterium]|nr:serine/threonine protein kinase [Verrucomicrobiota bacterium]
MLKFAPQSILNDCTALETLQAEVRCSLMLDHPHIARIHDFIKAGNLGFILMEYVDGKTLEDLCDDRPGHFFEPAEIEKWILQLCEALTYAHEKARLVHNNLKPANLMVSAEGNLKVIGFGLPPSNGLPLANYMSPQQMDGEKPGALDDIYATGATIFHLYTGKPPLYHDTHCNLSDYYRLVYNHWLVLHEVAPPTMAVCRKELGIVGKPIPGKWEDVVAACLAKNPAKRPQSAREIAVRLGLCPA